MKLGIILLVLVITIDVALWFVGRQFALDHTIIYIAMGAVALLALIGYLVYTVVAIRRSLTIEKALKDQGKEQAHEATESGRVALGEMQKQFQSYLQALKTSPTGRGALATLPWYLVIGAPGSGKTTALQESGLAFSSMGHGVRSIRGIGGTRNCDWWFTDNAIFLDTAGRYTTQPEDQGEWFAFLDLIREVRKQRALNGIVVVVSVADLVKGDASNLAGTVRPIRERIAEVSARLKLVLPVYVVFSKADLMGGFKDFFSHFDRLERDQIWGCTLTRADTAGKSMREVYAEQVARLMPNLQIKRLAALSGDRPRAQVMKSCLFSVNFLATQKWFGEFIGELFAPSALPDQPVFRGFYFTSGIQVQRTGLASASGKQVMPSEPAQGAFPAPPRTEVSFFFTPDQSAPPVEVADQRRGFFLKQLFARVIIGDRGLATLPSRLIRRARIVRFLAVYGSIALGALLMIALTVRFIGDRSDIRRATDICQQAVASAAKGDQAAQLAALDSMRVLLEEIGRHPSPGGRELVRRVQDQYYPLLSKLFTDAAMARLATQIEQMRRGKTQTNQNDLFDLLHGYLMLGGSESADPRLLEVVLKDQQRWFSGLMAQGPISAEAEHLGDRQLDYLIAHCDSSHGWQGHQDDALVERVRSVLGSTLMMHESFADAEESVQGGMSKVDRTTIFGDNDKDLLTIDGSFSSVYTREGWETVFKGVLDDRVSLLVKKYQTLHQDDKSPNEIRAQLRALYAHRYNDRWLNLIKTTRPTDCADLTQASAKLRALTASDTPYHDLIKSLKTAADLHFDSADSRISLPTDGKWLEDGLTATKDLQHAVDEFLNTTQSGARLADLGKLKRLGDAADKAASAYDAATAGIDDHAAADACRACLGNLILAVRQGLLGEIGGEIDRSWQDTVRKPIADQLAGRFPLVVTATTDAALPAFDRIFNPKSGSFWMIVKRVEELRHFRFGGVDLLPVSDEYARMLSPARSMTEALFVNDSETMAISFTITLDPREGIKDVILAVGDQKFHLNERPDRRMTMTWKQGDPAGAKLSVQLATPGLLTKDQPSPGWGIIRLLRDGAPTDRPEGGSRLTWTFDATSLGKKYNASAIVEAPALEYLIKNPFVTIPARLTP